MAENRLTLPDIIAERTTCRLTAQFTDETAANLQKVNLTTLTMTLYALGSGAIINGNDGVNILDANQGVVSAEGLLTLTLAPLDNQILDSALDLELHRILLTWTFGGGAKTGRFELDLYVRNLMKVS